MTRGLTMLPLALAAALAGVGVALHAQGNQTLPQATHGTFIVPPTPTRASLRDWQFPGMEPQTDDGYPQVATVTGRAIGDYAQILDFYAKKMGTSGYDPKQVAQFQPKGHATITGLGMNFDGGGSCYADSQVMHATLCRRYDHESVSVFLSTHRQSGVTNISLTDTTF